ncbi:MAG: lipid-binding SYLF domain-containing protein [Bryobacteraceae bacterium]|nr:lipid-binding SYLF domain-containing protein [Bryobacteraceae bacterium]
MLTRILCTLAIAAGAVFAGEAEDKRLEAAAVTLKEIMDVSDKAIPQDLFAKASCAVIIPGAKKGGFILAGQYGRGFASCRQPDGKGWTAPAAMRMEGGSIGFQAGGQETDIILLVMNQKGMERLTSSKFTLGGDASIAAGPVGRSTTAATDITMRAEILSWSRSRGVFGGISLKGSTLRPDRDVDQVIYGKEMDSVEILRGKVPTPKAAQELISLLNKYSGRAN